MLTMPASSINIAPNRQRKEFSPEAVIDLANSITVNGLLHPPVFRSTPDGMVLVAGERRLRAIESIWLMGSGIRVGSTSYDPDVLPYTDIGSMTELAAEEAELDENLKREDLSWQEEAAAIARLHSLRTRQAALVGETHSIADTAVEVKGSSFGSAGAETRQSIILADHLANPAVAKAKTQKDAFKILKKEEATRSNQALASRVGKTFNSSIHELHHANCLDYLKSCPDNTFDVILTDPPYGMNAQNFGDGGGKLDNSEHHYDDSFDSWFILINSLAPELYRVSKPQAHAYIFCDIAQFFSLGTILRSAGWYVFRTPLINYKPNSGRVPLPEHGPRRQYEICLYAIKGHKPVTGIYSDVITSTLEENLTHGAQKPVGLYTDLLRRSVRPGDVVLDCFAGTGTIFPAAHAMKCKAVGVELSPEYYGISVARLNDLDSEPALL